MNSVGETGGRPVPPHPLAHFLPLQGSAASRLRREGGPGLSSTTCAPAGPACSHLGYSRAARPVRFLLGRRQDVVVLAWLSALILSWALWKPGCSCIVSKCPSLVTPLGSLFPDFVFPRLLSPPRITHPLLPLGPFLEGALPSLRLGGGQGPTWRLC